MNNKLIESLKYLNMYEEDFISFLDGKIHYFPYSENNCIWSCFPKLGQYGRIIDIRLVVPIIKDTKTLLINVHEFTHAYDLYKRLNQIDNQNEDEEYEHRAKQSEERILKLL